MSRYGFELIRPDPCLTHAFPDGRSLTVHRDLERTCQNIARYSQKDADTWRNCYQAFLEQKDSICPAFNSPPPSFAEQAASLQNLPGGLDRYRFQMQNLRSWCSETFEAEETKVLLGTWAVHGGVSPDDVGGGSMVWLFSMVIQHFGNNVVKGGMRNLPLALNGFLKAHNGEIRTNAQVKQIVVENGKAVAVRLLDGEEIESGKLIASNAHPRHLALDLLGEKEVGADIAGKIRRYELGEPVMVIYLALEEPINYKAGSKAGQSVYVHTSPPSLDYFSRLFTEARGGLLPEEPFALICSDTAADPSRVPSGKGLMKLVVQPVPYVIKEDAASSIGGAHWDAAKEPFAERLIELPTRNYVPDLREKIVKRVVHSPWGCMPFG